MGFATTGSQQALRYQSLRVSLRCAAVSSCAGSPATRGSRLDMTEMGEAKEGDMGNHVDGDSYLFSLCFSDVVRESIPH